MELETLVPGDPLWWGIAAFVAVLGLVIGSFLNVVAWRLPREESLSKPRSACPSCGRPVRARDNIPVLSWLVLRGKCRDCKAPISPRYLVVELATAALFVLVWWKFAWSIELIAFLYLAALAVVLTSIDLAVHRLPNALVLPAYPVLAVLFTAESAMAGEWWPLARAAIGGVVLFTFYFGAAIVYPGGMGFGDVKLAGVLGAALAWLGWGPLVIGSFAAFLLGGLGGLLLIALKKTERRGGIPFGPWMFAGAAVGVAWGADIWKAYIGSWS